MAELAFTFLGTGTSIGVPVIGCDCEVCRSRDPRNRRLRSSIYVEAPDRRWIVDSGPDLREQCLREDIREIDAVLITHQHTDHIMGFDDLRRFTLGRDASLPVYANQSTLNHLQRAFDFAFNGENRYPGYFKPEPRLTAGPFSLGETQVTPLPVEHGKVETQGYLFERGGHRRLAYIPDAKRIPDATLDLMHGVEALVLDALRPTEHYTHLSLAESLEIAEAVQAERSWFTHFSCEMNYAEIEPTLPPGVSLAWDGLKVELP